MRNKKTAKGITLIALVITIIVLLILAGVSIAMLTGDNGILTEADNAKMETIVATVKENLNLEQIGKAIEEKEVTPETLFYEMYTLFDLYSEEAILLEEEKRF